MAAVDIVPVAGEMFEQTPGVGEPGCVSIYGVRMRSA